jgi:uncharacterized protein (DUF302 family)
MLRRKPEVKTVTRQKNKGYKATIATIDAILSDTAFTLDVRVNMARKAAKAALDTETYEVIERRVA